MSVPQPLQSVNAEKYKHMLSYVHNMKVRDVRQIFSYFRKLDDENPNVFFPEYGLTAGEFSVMYVQNMAAKPRTAAGVLQAPACGEVWAADDALP
jgi:hypothetical protein